MSRSANRPAGPRRVLVTGAASGLGRAIASRYAQDGCLVLLTDIDQDALTIVEKDLSRISGVVSRRLDVRDDGDWARARQWCEDTWDGLDLLVNNAGVAAGGRMELVAMDDWDWIIELNLKSVVRGCRTFIPLLKRQGYGQILNTASLAGLANLPAMAPYNVTKAAVISLSQTLRHELAPYGVGVSVLCPAFVSTNLASSMRSPEPVAIERAGRLISQARVSADEVAEKVFQGVAAGRFLILTHREGVLLTAALRVAPGLVERSVIRRWNVTRRSFEREAAPS